MAHPKPQNSYALAAAQGALSRGLSRLVPIWRDRQDSEHEQAVIRLLVGIMAAGYLLLFTNQAQSATAKVFITNICITVFFFSSVVILIWITLRPQTSRVRRLYGCVTDTVATTMVLYINGALAAPVFIVYLWVTFGNGFRYGKKYLYFSMTLSLIGFLSVVFGSGAWTLDKGTTFGLVVGLVALPLYVASLIGRLETTLVFAEIANQAKSNFLATMSHEIRTPLNGMIGILTLFDTRRLSDKQKHYVDLLKQSSQWLLNVISDGLDFTKIEAQELILDPAPTDLRELLQGVADLYREVSRVKGVRFIVDLDASLPTAVICDSHRLRQILNNLLSNACKFTDSGQIVFRVGVKARHEGLVELQFGVEDTGTGIAREHQRYIFDPFKQLPQQQASHHQGTGLGLAIAASLVTLMGGEINVISEFGCGAAFIVNLSFAIAEENDIRNMVPGFHGTLWNRPPVILLVEDNHVNQEVAATYLKLLGCQVVVADDGKAALEILRNESFDLIFMDCQMPNLNGYEATRKIREIEGRGDQHVIIALTAHVTREDREKCRQAGMNDYMGKPYALETLKGMMVKWLPELVKQEAEDTAPVGHETIQNGTDTADQQGANRVGYHNLCNSLTGAMGNIELALLRREDTTEMEEHLRAALSAVKRAVSLATGIER